MVFAWVWYLLNRSMAVRQSQRRRQSSFHFSLSPAVSPSACRALPESQRCKNLNSCWWNHATAGGVVVGGGRRCVCVCVLGSRPASPPGWQTWHLSRALPQVWPQVVSPFLDESGRHLQGRFLAARAVRRYRDLNDKIPLHFMEWKKKSADLCTGGCLRWAFTFSRAAYFFPRGGRWISLLTSCHVYLSEQVHCSWFVKRAGVPPPKLQGMALGLTTGRHKWEHPSIMSCLCHTLLLFIFNS